MERASAALGEDFEALLLDGGMAEQLSRTREAQLQVFLASVAAWEAGVLIKDDVPVAFAGHSLGQLTALVAASVLTIEDGVALVARRAEVTQAAADAAPGKMAALLGATLEQATTACAAAPDACWIANDNAPGQIVIAGTPDGVDAAVAAAADAGVKRAMSLKVGAAFHTPLMQAACEPYAAALADVAFATPTAPVVSNGDAAAHADSDAWRERLVDHLISPVRWRESQLALVATGAASFVEVGGAGTLAGMAKRTVPDTPVRVVSEPITESAEVV